MLPSCLSTHPSLALWRIRNCYLIDNFIIFLTVPRGAHSFDTFLCSNCASLVLCWRINCCEVGFKWWWWWWGCRRPGGTFSVALPTPCWLSWWGFEAVTLGGGAGRIHFHWKITLRRNTFRVSQCYECRLPGQVLPRILRTWAHSTDVNIN